MENLEGRLEDNTRNVDIHSDIKNKPEEGVRKLRERFENPKGKDKLIDEFFLISNFLGYCDYASAAYKSRKNWYDAFRDLLLKLNINVEIIGLENLDSMGDNESGFVGDIHNSLIAGPIGLATVGYYFYCKRKDSGNRYMKIITNLVLKGMGGFEDIGIFIRNESNERSRKTIKDTIRVYNEEVTPYLKQGGIILNFLRIANPTKSFDIKNPWRFLFTKYGKLYYTFLKCEKNTDKIIPVYVEFPKDPFISNNILSRIRINFPKDLPKSEGPIYEIKKFMNKITNEMIALKSANFLTDLSRLIGETCTIYIGKPIDPKNDPKYLEAEGRRKKKVEYIADECSKLKEKYKGVESVNLKDLPEYMKLFTKTFKYT